MYMSKYYIYKRQTLDADAGALCGMKISRLTFNCFFILKVLLTIGFVYAHCFVFVNFVG